MHIKLPYKDELGRDLYVDKPPMGSLQPDWFGIYAVGCSNLPIPDFHPDFVRHFFTRASALGISGNFSMA